MKIYSDDLIDASGLAEVLGLANRTSVSVYQRRYLAMPRPVVDLGRGRTKLWSGTAIELLGAVGRLALAASHRQRRAQAVHPGR